MQRTDFKGLDFCGIHLPLPLDGMPVHNRSTHFCQLNAPQQHKIIKCFAQKTQYIIRSRNQNPHPTIISLTSLTIKPHTSLLS